MYPDLLTMDGSTAKVDTGALYLCVELGKGNLTRSMLAKQIFSKEA